MNFTISNDVLFFTDEKNIFIDVAAGGELVQLTDPLEVQFVKWLENEKTFSWPVLEAEIKAKSVSSELVSEFIKLGIIVEESSNRKAMDVERCFGTSDLPDSWLDFASYHISVCDYEFLNMGAGGAMFADNKIMQNYRSLGQPPPLTLEFGENIGMQCLFFEEILNEKKFQNGVLCKYSLSCVLDFVFGIRSTSGGRDVQIGDKPYWELPKNHKIVPSGGGRHPTEAFVVVKNLDSFGSGLFHFNQASLQLRRINDGERLSQLLSLAEGETAVILCPEYLRAMWRYRDPRSFRAIPIDIGHLLGAMEIICSYLDLEMVHILNFDSHILANAIEVLGPTQVPMAIAKIAGRKIK